MKASHASAEQRLDMREEYLAGQFFIVDLISEKSAFRTHGLVLNMSNGGMAVQTFCPLVQGQVAEIHLTFPNVSSISMGAGLVAWEKQGGLAGIRFLNPPLKNLAELRQLVLQNFSPTDSDSAPPLFACRNNSGASPLDTTLHLFACSAMALAGSTGAAIAIGNSSGMECRASVGNAPDVGARLQPDNGLSGHSLRTGAVNLCDDAWTDSRVNMTAARQLDARSIVIVPITMAENVVGLLEAFSGDTNHFDERHVHRLLPIVNVLAAVPELETALRGSDATSYDEVAMPEEPAHVAATPQITNRSWVVAIGIMAALLALIVGIALFGSRVRAKFLGNTKFSTSTQSDARQSSANVAEQSAISNAKPAIGFNPSVIDEKLGATFDVDVLLRGAKDVLSVPVQIAYDPEKLLLITATNGGLLNRDGQAAALVQRAEPLDGHIDVSISRPSSAPGISGDGAVFTLKFLSKAPGRSNLRIKQTALRDTSAKILSVDCSEAVVTISKL